MCAVAAYEDGAAYRVPAASQIGVDLLRQRAPARPRGRTGPSSGSSCAAPNRGTHSSSADTPPSRASSQLLRRVPDARPDVRRDARIEFDLHALGRSGVYAERVGEHVVADGLLSA